jgi:hypothetical protein
MYREAAMYFGDIVIHIDETLDDDRIRDLERALGCEEGVYDVSVHKKQRHLLVVDFDPDRVRPGHILQSVCARGLHAEMIPI